MPKLKNDQGYALCLYVALSEVKIDQIEQRCEELKEMITEYKNIQKDMLIYLQSKKEVFKQNQKEYNTKLHNNEEPETSTKKIVIEYNLLRVRFDEVKNKIKEATKELGNKQQEIANMKEIIEKVPQLKHLLAEIELISEHQSLNIKGYKRKLKEVEDRLSNIEKANTSASTNNPSSNKEKSQEQINTSKQQEPPTSNVSDVTKKSNSSLLSRILMSPKKASKEKKTHSDDRPKQSKITFLSKLISPKKESHHLKISRKSSIEETPKNPHSKTTHSYSNVLQHTGATPLKQGQLKTLTTKEHEILDQKIKHITTAIEATKSTLDYIEQNGDAHFLRDMKICKLLQQRGGRLVFPMNQSIDPNIGGLSGLCLALTTEWLCKEDPHTKSKETSQEERSRITEEIFMKNSENPCFVIPMMTPISNQAIRLTAQALQTASKLSCLSPEVIKHAQYKGEAHQPEVYQTFHKAEEILEQAVFSHADNNEKGAKVGLLTSKSVLSSTLTTFYDGDENQKTFSHAIGVREEDGVYQFFDPNFGCIECQDEKTFKECFNLYFKLKKYDQTFTHFSCKTFSNENLSHPNFNKTNLFYVIEHHALEYMSNTVLLHDPPDLENIAMLENLETGMYFYTEKNNGNVNVIIKHPNGRCHQLQVPDPSQLCMPDNLSKHNTTTITPNPSLIMDMLADTQCHEVDAVLQQREEIRNSRNDKEAGLSSIEMPLDKTEAIDLLKSCLNGSSPDEAVVKGSSFEDSSRDEKEETSESEPEPDTPRFSPT